MKVVALIVIGLIVVVALLAGIVAFIGSRLPKEHSVSRSIFLHKTPTEVYQVVRDLAAAPGWRSDVKKVTLEDESNGRVHFQEEGKNGTIKYELSEDLPGQRMVTKILNTDLGYSGKWTYLFTSEKDGTRLTITEDGEVSNVIFRFMSKYVFGQTATLDSYLTALAKRFGENTQPQ